MYCLCMCVCLWILGGYLCLLLSLCILNSSYLCTPPLHLPQLLNCKQPASKSYVTEIFHLLDKDNSGTLCKEEFATVMKILYSQVFTRIMIQWSLTLMSKCNLIENSSDVSSFVTCEPMPHLFVSYLYQQLSL